MSTMVTVQRTDPDGTIHTYAWPESLAKADNLTIIDEPAVDTHGQIRRASAVTKPTLVTEPAVPDGQPVTDPKPIKPAAKADKPQEA
jgi:hypothetical protein